MNQSIEQQKTRVAWISVFSNTFLTIGKLIVGILIGSISVISEAIHSGLDLVASIIALYAVKQSNKPPDKDHPYGHGKFENVSGTVEALLIFVAAIWIIVEAVEKLQHPKLIEGAGWGVGLMLISVIMNIIVSEMLFRVARKAQSVALEADAWHLRTDVYTSLGVMIALFMIWIFSKIAPSANVQWIDPVAAIGVALLIIKAAYELTIQAARDLFDMSLPEKELEWIQQLLRDIPEVKGFHNLRTRKSGMNRFIEFHMVVDPSTSVAISHQLTDDVSEKIEKHFEHADVTIHIEPCYRDRCSYDCRNGCFGRF